MLADDPQGRVAGFDGDGLADVAEAGLDALEGDLDAAAAGDLPLDGQAGLRPRVWPGEADALRARWVSRTRGFTVTDGTAGMCADLQRHWLSLCPALISKLMVRPTWTLGQEGIASLPGATRSDMIALMPPSIRVRASPPGGRWPSFRDTRSLVAGGLRVRGWVWLLSMLWVVAGAVGTGYDFYITTKPYTWADVSLGIEGWSTDPEAVRIAVVLATVALLALPIPLLIAGFVRFRGLQPRNWLRIAAWAGAWIAGFALIYQTEVWGEYPGNSPAIGSPAVVSWGELAICAAWLVLGAVLTWILAGPAHRSDVPDTSSRLPSAKGSRLPPGTDDVQA